MLWSSLLLAVREVRRNILRSFLTVLGIVIGVSAVVTMVTLGNGATESVRQQVENLGSNLLMLRQSRFRRGPPGSAGGHDSRGARGPRRLEEPASRRGAGERVTRFGHDNSFGSTGLAVDASESDAVLLRAQEMGQVRYWQYG